jgi:nucleoside-diphosphate-sugar epimerase
MKILVTGGGGFLGTWVIRELLKDPSVMVTSFSRHPYQHLEDMGVPTVRGDLGQTADVERVLRSGFDAIIHTAAKVGMWGPAAEFERTNLLGTRNLLHGARAHGVKRFVYTSTPSVVFGKGGHAGGDETLPIPARHLADYPRTKALAEAEVLAANDGGFTTVALRPHLVWGPGDQNLIPRVIERARAGKLKIVGDGQNSVDVVYVEDAARAHVRALHAPADRIGGQAYFIGDGPVKLWDFIGEILKRAGVPAPDDGISVKTAYAIGWLLEKAWSLAGIDAPEPPMTRFVALNLGRDHYYSHQRALADLGWRAEVGIAEGMERLFAHREQNRRLVGTIPPLPPG